MSAGRFARISVYFAMVGAAWAALAALSPPVVVGADAAADTFSAARAMRHVEAVAAVPHPMGSTANRAAADYIVHAARESGLEVELQEASACTELAGMTRCGHVRNVIARLTGADPNHKDAVMLAAHYDSVPSGPGANDDAAGVAALLETARALAFGPRPFHDVVFLFSDGEEEALLGAAAFVQSAHPWRANVRVALNFEARGSRGPSAMYEAPLDSGDLVKALGESAPHVTATSLMTTISRVLPNGADSFAFTAVGIPTMSFAYVDGYERYHYGTDAIESFDPRCLQHHGDYALNVARRLARATPLPLGGGEVVYFDIVGRYLVTYPAWLARLLGILAALAFAATMRRERARPRTVARGAAFYFAAIAATAVAVVALEAVERLFASPHLLFSNYKCLAPAHGAAAVVAVLWARRLSARGGELGPLLVWAFVGLVLGLVAPGASFVVQIPLLAVLAARACAKYPSAAALPCVVGALLLAQAVGATFLALGQDGPAIPAALLTWGLAGLALVVPFATTPEGSAAALPSASFATRWRVELVACAAAIALALTGAFVARKDRASPRADSLLYVVDDASQRARWVSFTATPDAYTAAALGVAPERARLPTIEPENLTVFQAPAPAPHGPLEPPRVEVESDTQHDGRRVVSLRIRAAAGARELTLFAPSAERPRSIAVDGSQPFPLVRFGRELDARLFRLLGGPASAGVSLSILAPPRDGVRLDLDLSVAPLDLTVVQKSPGFAVDPPAARSTGQMRSWRSDETWITTTTHIP